MGYTPHVLVVGTGPTGAGLARDLAMRGLEVTLVGRGPLGSGAAGGLLNCGARLAAESPERAARVHVEAQRLREIAAHCVEETGGVIANPAGDGSTIDAIREGCAEADIPVEELDAETLGEREPRLAASVDGGLAVPDARIDPFELTVATAESAREHDATVEPGTTVTDLFVDGSGITHATLRQPGEPGEMHRVDYVVDASGDRPGRIATLAGVEPPLARETGLALVANERPTERVVTTTDPGPRVVPTEGRCVLESWQAQAGQGTGDPVTPAAVDDLLADATTLIRDVDTARVLRGWPVGRAVTDDGDGPDEGGVGVRVVDHEARDGLWGLSTVAGTGLTTHRLAAAAAADQVCGKFGIDRACLTGSHPLPERETDPATLASEHGIDPNPVVCTCESVNRAAVQDALDEASVEGDFDAVRARTHAGMGECGDGRCAHRLAAELHPAAVPETVENALDAFLRSRWQGQRHAAWGEQLAEMARTYRLHAGTLQRGTDPGAVALAEFEGGNGDRPRGPGGQIP
jgi:glycerol-3-phosphate dehydrogenase